MANVNGPSGFRPVKHAGGGTGNRTQRYHIASGYGTQITSGDAVIPTTTSKNIIRGGSGTVRLQGVFKNCFYLDPNQADPQYNRIWPAAQVTLGANLADCWVYDDPATIFEGQCDGAFTLANIGFLADLTLGTGSTLTKISADQVASATIGSGTTVKILDYVNAPDNSVGANARLWLQISNHYNGPALTAA